jgi:hypothetical protein
VKPTTKEREEKMGVRFLRPVFDSVAAAAFNTVLKGACFFLDHWQVDAFT